MTTATSDDAVPSTAEERINAFIHGSDEQAPVSVEEPDEDSEDTLEGDQVDEEVGEEEEESEESEESDDSDSDSDDDNSLAKALGLDEGQVDYDADGNLVFNAKVDGEVVQLTAREVLKSLQLERHVNRKSVELSEKQKEFQQQAQAIQQQYAQKIEEADAAISLVEKEILSEYNSINWDQLKQTDPGLYAAKRQDFSERAGQIQGMKQQVLEERQSQMEQAQEHQRNVMQEMLARERAAMLEKNPEWNDPQRFQEDVGSIKSFLTDTYGFKSEETDQIYDHRLISVIQDAKAYRSAKQAAKTQLKRAIPKFQKPGSGKDQQLSKARQMKAKHQNLRKTGSIQDALAILNARSSK